MTNQPDPGLLATFVRLFPELIREAAQSPLGVIALIVLVLSLVTMVLFRRGTKITLIAFLAFLLAVTFLGYRVMEVYPDVVRENREMVIGPQTYKLEKDTVWTAPNIRIRGGTLVETTGHSFGIDATKGELVIEGLATIQSFAPGDVPLPPAEKPPAASGPDLAEAGQCNNAGPGNTGGTGEPGAAGTPGKNAGTISISAPRARGALEIMNRGMDGGPGGRGGNGGTGGKGQRGGRGRQNYLDGPFGVHVATDCACGGAFGGKGGRGGGSGTGGPGGPGGGGGEVVLSVADTDDFKITADLRGGCSGRSGPPGQPGEPGIGGDGGGGDGPACRDESTSRRGENGTERGNVPSQPATLRVRGTSGRLNVNGASVPVTLVEALECS